MCAYTQCAHNVYMYLHESKYVYRHTSFGPSEEKQLNTCCWSGDVPIMKNSCNSERGSKLARIFAERPWLMRQWFECSLGSCVDILFRGFLSTGQILRVSPIEIHGHKGARISKSYLLKRDFSKDPNRLVPTTVQTPAGDRSVALVHVRTQIRNPQVNRLHPGPRVSLSSGLPSILLRLP